MTNLDSYISPEGLKTLAVGLIIGVVGWVVIICSVVFVIYKLL